MKAQASMEFITTYAWAISVVLVMVGAVIYFGVFNEETFLKPYCSITTELVCEDNSMHENGVRLKLRNNFEKDITISQIALSTDSGTTTSCNIADVNISIGRTENFECRFASNVLPKGSKQKVYSTIVFSRKGGTNTYNASGSMLAQVLEPLP